MAEEAERPPPRAPLGGHLAWWPFAAALGVAAALVIAVVLVNVLAGGGTTGSRQQGTGLTSSGAAACPPFFQHPGTAWLPAKPAGVHSKKNLVPKLHPTHVTVCEYLGRSGARAKSLELTGQRELGGQLDRVVATLRKLPPAAKRPPACATYISPKDANDYLIGMRYDEAIVWVSAPGNHCLGAQNGPFSTDRNISALAAASYRAREWVSSP